jgi:hypothetical protein
MLKISSTLKIEAARSSETSVNYEIARRHIPEDSILHAEGKKKKR